MAEIDKAKFLHDNLGLIKKFANKYHFATPKFSFEDLVQVGNKAAIRALDSFDPDRNIKATTYVGKAIDRDIREFVGANKYDAHVTNDAQRKAYKKTKETGKKHSFDELSAIRLDWGWENSSGDETSFSSVLPSGSPPPEEQMMVEEQKEILLEEIERLPAVQKRVIMGKFFEGSSFVDLGEELGYTRQRVKQIQQETFDILKIRLGTRLDGFIARPDGLVRR